MKVDPNEILFIRENTPFGLMKTLADNVGLKYSQVRTEFHTLKDDYTDELVIEARRLLKATTGKEYKPQIIEEAKAS